VTLVAIPVGLVTAFAIRKWPHHDPMAPKIDPATVEVDARSHPALRALINSRLDPSTETGLLLTASVIGIVAAVSAVGTLAEMIRTNRGLANYDLVFSRWGAKHATSASTSGLKLLSLLGGYPGVTLLAIGVAVYEYRRHMARSVPALLITVVGGQFALTNAIKYFVDRARPNIGRLTGFSGSSFPSGHAAAAAASYAVCAFLLGRRRSVRTKAILGGVAAGIATAVASTRVLLGVHWFTDVLAGLFVGWAWFSLVSIAFGGRVLRFGEPLKIDHVVKDAGVKEAVAKDAGVKEAGVKEAGVKEAVANKA
jgi:membrane-associated phospholipid phosphatase